MNDAVIRVFNGGADDGDADAAAVDAAGAADAVVASDAVMVASDVANKATSSAAQPPAYSAKRRTPRRHRRVVMKGTERFDADGVKLEAGDMRTREQRAADDDRRILGELPPHWGVFAERGR